jgi:hypothetical protein
VLAASTMGPNLTLAIDETPYTNLGAKAVALAGSSCIWNVAMEAGETSQSRIPRKPVLGINHKTHSGRSGKCEGQLKSAPALSL